MKRITTCVGIDLARRAKHKALVGGADDCAGTNRALSFSHDLEGLTALSAYLRARTGRSTLEGLAVNMEPTSGAFEPMAAFLRGEGAQVFYTRTDVVSQLRKVHSRFAKTDRIDARALAGVAFSFPERLIPAVEIEPRIRRMRQLSAQRHTMVEDSTRWKNRLIAKIEPHWRPLLAQLDGAERFCQLARAFFGRFADPRKAAALGREAFVQWCAGRAHGGTNRALFETFWRGSLASARLCDELERRGHHVDWETLKALARQDLRMIKACAKEVETLDKRIRHARRDMPECDLVQQLPGVGPVVSVTLTSLLMPIERFANAKKCGAYTGFTSRRKSSGDREVEGLKITKTGNRRLKRDLALAADTAMKNDAELATFAIGLLRAGKHYNKVRVAVGRKLAVRAYSLLKRHASGECGVGYIWRDADGAQITKKQAKLLATEFWSAHKAEK